MTGGPLLLRFVRGLADVVDIESLGIRVGLTDGLVTIDEPAGLRVIEAGIADVSTGLLARWMREGEVWAQVVLGLNAIDLAPLERDPTGGLLLEALWDMASGRSPADEARGAAASHAGD